MTHQDIIYLQVYILVGRNKHVAIQVMNRQVIAPIIVLANGKPAFCHVNAL